MRFLVLLLTVVSIGLVVLACGGKGTKPEGVEVVVEEERLVAVTIEDGVLFDKNSASLKPLAKAVIHAKSGEIKAALAQYSIVVEGHTDDSGTRDFNMALSQKRAEAVAALLMNEAGIAPGHISAKGFGPDRPKFPNNTEENRSKNRRVEIILDPLESPVPSPQAGEDVAG